MQEGLRFHAFRYVGTSFYFCASHDKAFFLGRMKTVNNVMAVPGISMVVCVCERVAALVDRYPWPGITSIRHKIPASISLCVLSSLDGHSVVEATRNESLSIWKIYH